jgi:hypothetical protein
MSKRVLKHGTFRAFTVLNDAGNSGLPESGTEPGANQAAKVVDGDGDGGQKRATKPAADVRVPQRARSPGFEEEN